MFATFASIACSKAALARSAMAARTPCRRTLIAPPTPLAPGETGRRHGLLSIRGLRRRDRGDRQRRDSDRARTRITRPQHCPWVRCEEEAIEPFSDLEC